jgi:RNA polymerase sigma factor for flagellar operon FliA
MYPVSATEADSEVVRQHAQLVKRIAQHLLGRLPPCVQLEDLIQAGMIGLLEAAKNYDVTKGASFETYASIRIRGAMLDEIRKGDWAPRSVHRNTRRVAQAIREIENQQGRDARDHEVAKNLNLSLQEYHQLVQETNGSRMFAYHDVGINEESVSEGIGTSTPGPLDRLQKDDFKRSLAKGIESLPERERLVLALYYDEELNLRQVGEVLGVSESRVSQIHSQAMVRLQVRLKEWCVKDEIK